jgi:ketosteroid isomerase-like protein
MKKVTLLMALLYLLILNGCNNEVKLPEDYEAQVTAQISELMTKNTEAWENGDLETYWSCFDEDYFRLNSNNVVSNLEENIETYKDYFINRSFEDVKYKQIDFVVDHNYAFEINQWEQKLIDNEKQDTIQQKMSGFAVYKKQESGDWKIFRLVIK